MNAPYFRRTSQRPPKKTDSMQSALLAQSLGLKIKNPKDYVVLIGHVILDGRRSVTIKPTLPPSLDKGMELRYQPDNDPGVVVTVSKDYGDEVRVTFQDGQEKVVTRSHLSVIAEPSQKPRLIHKRKLRTMFGEAVGRIFWDGASNVRVPYSPPPKKKP